MAVASPPEATTVPEAAAESESAVLVEQAALHAEHRRLAAAEAERRKVEGNGQFRAGAYEAALLCYSGAIEALEASGYQELDLRAALASNQALCLLKLDRPAEAEERASAALTADPGNSKAVFRRGLARLALGGTAALRGAHEDLQKAVRLEPQNREVRKKCEEARCLLEELPAEDASSKDETALASGAASALGGVGGGLYSEKADLNEGRLAETYMEQKSWIKTIESWTEISDVSFAEEDGKNCIAVYMGLPGLQDVPPNKVCVWMQPTSLEVRVVDLRGQNWFWLARELWGQIDPEASSYKIRRDKLSLKLHKRASARSWDRWEKLRRI